MEICIHNIGELITFAPLARQKRTSGLSESDFGRVASAWLHLREGKVFGFGDGEPPRVDRMHDAKGSLLMPGLIDSHTHPVFGGDRAHEFGQRLAGTSYQEIAEAGGGIQSTVRATRAASDKELLERLQKQMKRSLELGITTQEVKSGYGLSPTEEIRHLKILKLLNEQVPQELSPTCLALHAASPELPDLAQYSAQCVTELLPVVAAEGLAEWVDAFIEDGYFSVDQVQPYAERAKELGLGIRLHADEFSDAGAAAAAAKWGAASADHMQAANPESFAALAKAGTVATLLPGTSVYTGIPYAQAKPLRDAGVPVAVATDFNPGSCMIDDLSFIATLAALHCGLSPVEGVAAVTYVAAHSLNRGDRKGALAEGHDADFISYDLNSIEQWLWEVGRQAPTEVWIRGQRVC